MSGDTAFARSPGGPGIPELGVPGLAPLPADPFGAERLTPVDGLWKHIAGGQPQTLPPPLLPRMAGGRHLRSVDAPSPPLRSAARGAPEHMRDPDASPRRRSSAASHLVSASSRPGFPSSVADRPPSAHGALAETGVGHQAKVALYLLAITAAAVVWYFAISTLIVSRGTSLISGWDVTTIASGSMRPVLREGDLVAYRSIDVDDLRPGQIIVFDSPVTQGATLVHRFIGFNDDGTLTTKGDANSHSDSTPVSADAVLGTVKMVSPFGGFPSLLLFTGEYLTFGLLVAALVLSAVVVHAPVPRAVLRSPGGVECLRPRRHRHQPRQPAASPAERIDQPVAANA